MTDEVQIEEKTDPITQITCPVNQGHIDHMGHIHSMTILSARTSEASEGLRPRTN